MRITPIRRTLSVVLLLTTAVSLGAYAVALHLLEQRRQAYERLQESAKVLAMLTVGRDTLTTALRAYAATGEPHHLLDFELELAATQSRERAMLGLRGILTEGEYRLAEQAKRSSDQLVHLEDRIVAAVAAGHREAAVSLAFGTTYRHDAAALDPIRQLEAQVERRRRAEIADHAARARLASHVAVAALAVNVLVTGLGLAFPRRTVRAPRAARHDHAPALVSDRPERPCPPDCVATVADTPAPAHDSSSPPPVTAASAHEGLPAYLPGVDLELGLKRTLGRPDLYASLLVRFAGQWADAGRTVREALARGDASAAQRVAHSLKGVAAMLGATRVQAASAHLEDLVALRASTEAVAAGIVDLERELAEVVEGVRTRLTPPAAPPVVVGATVDREALVETTGQLWRLLAEGDTLAAAVMREHTPLLETAYGERLHAVRAAMDRFDYEEARDLLLEAAGACGVRL